MNTKLLRLVVGMLTVFGVMQPALAQDSEVMFKSFHYGKTPRTYIQDGKE